MTILFIPTASGALMIDVADLASSDTDLYGGYTAMPVAGGATGHFRIAEHDGRWLLVSPLGNAFWMRAVYNVTTIGMASGVLNAKYVLDPNRTPTQEWYGRVVRRLKSWGFNALGEYWANSLGVQPWASPSIAANSEQLPTIDYRNPMNYSRRMWTEGGPYYAWLSLKDLIYCGRPHLGGLDAGTSNPGATNDYVYTGWQGQISDVFDPLWPAAVGHNDDRERTTRWAELTDYGDCPWIIGISNDDTDYMWGIKKRDSIHLGWVCACTSPFQTLNFYTAQKQTYYRRYADARVHTKFAWREWLVGQYGTPSALAVTVTTDDVDATFSGAHGMSAGDFLQLTAGDDSGEIRRVTAVPTGDTATLERPYTTDQSAVACSKIPAAGALTALNTAWGSTYTTINGEDVAREEPIREVQNPSPLAPITTSASSAAITSSAAPTNIAHVYATAGGVSVEAYTTYTGCTWTTASTLITVTGDLTGIANNMPVRLVGAGVAGADITTTVNNFNVANKQFYVNGSNPSTAKTGNGVVHLFAAGLTAADENALITIPGAGTAGADLSTRVDVVTDSGHFTVDDTIVTTVSDVTAALGRGPFASADIGRCLSIPGAGAAGATLSTSLATVTDPTHATIGTAASTTVTNVTGTIYRAITWLPDLNGRGYRSEFARTLQYEYALWGTGNGRLAYTGLLPVAFPPYDPANMESSVSIKVGGSTVGTDDGNGAITGATIASGAIDYTTGVYSFTFTAGNGPTDGAALTIAYTGNGWLDSGGTGVLDECGKNTWMAASTDSDDWSVKNNQDYVELPYLTDNYPAVAADLEAFYAVFCDRTFKYSCGLIKERYPNLLVFSPFAIRYNARTAVWESLGDYCDAVQVSALWEGESTALLKTPYDASGKPVFCWFGFCAQEDSPLAGISAGSNVDFDTQALRGQHYKDQLAEMLALQGTDGKECILGIDWWNYMDHPAIGEGLNWGLVTLKDNAYDGNEAVVAAGTDSEGYATGGETDDYGDFLTKVTEANAGVFDAL